MDPSKENAELREKINQISETCLQEINEREKLEEKLRISTNSANLLKIENAHLRELKDKKELLQKSVLKKIFLVWYGVSTQSSLTAVPFPNLEEVLAFFEKFEESVKLTNTRPHRDCRYYEKTLGDYKSGDESSYPFRKEEQIQKAKPCYNSDSESD